MGVTTGGIWGLFRDIKGLGFRIVLKALVKKGPCRIHLKGDQTKMEPTLWSFWGQV